MRDETLGPSPLCSKRRGLGPGKRNFGANQVCKSAVLQMCTDACTCVRYMYNVL
jgi:hypothetical protein